MKYIIFLSVLLLSVSLGCQNKDNIFSEKVFVEQFKSSLIKQGVDIEEVKPGGFIKMQGKLPEQFEVSQNNKNPDNIYVFSFSSSKEAEEALATAKFATTSETLVNKYRNKNIVIIHYVRPGNIGELQSKVAKSIDIEE